MGTFVGIVGKTEVPKEHLETYVKQMLTVWKYGGNDAVYPYVDPDKITTMFLFATSPLLSQSGNTKSSIKGNTLKEPLNKTPTADDGSFPPILRFEKWEIHKVFRHFPNLVLTKNLSPSTAADLIRASLTRIA